MSSFAWTIIAVDSVGLVLAAIGIYRSLKGLSKVKKDRYDLQCDRHE